MRVCEKRSMLLLKKHESKEKTPPIYGRGLRKREQEEQTMAIDRGLLFRGIFS